MTRKYLHLIDTRRRESVRKLSITVPVEVLPLSSTPRNVTTTPASGVCAALSTTVRPRKVVVTPVIFSDTEAVCLTDWPPIVADALTERDEVLVGWLAGAERVRMEVWFTEIELGLKLAVMPLGKPVTLRVDNPVKPFALLSVTAKVVDCP